MNDLDAHSFAHATSVQSLQDAPENSVFKVTLREELTEVPRALLRHRSSIQFLDLSNNQLKELPEWISELSSLEILFSSFNHLITLPQSLSKLFALSMVGARGNGLEYLSEEGIPPSLRWLTLTDNQLTSLPESISVASKMQKLLLAGNRLTTLPDSLASCSQLELLRVSANDFQTIPKWIFSHPSLAWVASAGNPVTRHTDIYTERYIDSRIEWSDLSLSEELGKGASGITYRGTRTHKNTIENVAVKVFNSSMSSDGSADDELFGALTARAHQNLLTPLGYFENHPEGKKGLVYPLLTQDYTPLAAPPSFETITRDVYPHERTIPAEQALHYARDIVAATAHLHSKNLLHGDLYAHNTLVNDHHALLSDFGATLHLGALETSDQEGLQRLELRSLGILLAELSGLIWTGEEEEQQITNSTITYSLMDLGERLQQPALEKRPKAEQVLQELKAIIQG